MAGKKFDPFEDEDNMEFVPSAGSEDEEPAPAPESNPVANHATQIKQRPAELPKRASGLKIEFTELQEQGTDTRGATRIGAEKLGADDFLTGIKRKDFDGALEKAKAAQNAPAHAPVQDMRIARTVRAPIYLLGVAMMLFVAVLVGGFYGYQAYLQQQEAARLRALQGGQPGH